MLRAHDQRAMRRHLIVFSALPARNQAGIHGVGVEVFIHDGLAFLDDAGDAVAVLATWPFTEAFEDLLEPGNLPRVSSRCVSKARRRSGVDAGLCQLRQCSVSWRSAS